MIVAPQLRIRARSFNFGNMSAEAVTYIQLMPTTDMDAAMRFYHDALGTAVVYRYPAEGDPVFVF